MAQDTVDLSFLAKLGQKTNDGLKMLKKDVGEIRTLCLQSYDYMKRVERRSGELRGDVEITIKMELGGGIAHLQTGLESGLRRIEDKLDELSHRLTSLEKRPEGSTNKKARLRNATGLFPLMAYKDQADSLAMTSSDTSKFE